VIQKIRIRAKVYDCDGKLDAKATKASEGNAGGKYFWEILGHFEEKKKDTGADKESPDDTYNIPGHDDCTRGWVQIDATAAMYKTPLETDVRFIKNNKATNAGDAASTIIDPGLPAPNSNLVTHNMLITWDSCKKKQSDSVVATYLSPQK
jgi:hypothetical protein